MISWVHNMPRVVVGRENPNFGLWLSGSTRPQNCHRLGRKHDCDRKAVFRLLARQIPNARRQVDILPSHCRHVATAGTSEQTRQPEVPPGRRLAGNRRKERPHFLGSQEPFPALFAEPLYTRAGIRPKMPEFLCLPPDCRQQGPCSIRLVGPVFLPQLSVPLGNVGFVDIGKPAGP